jgi:predicted dehydrogenase
MAYKPVKVGIIGCGNISGTYFTFCKKLEILQVVACSDIIPERAEAASKKFDIPHWGTNEVVLGNDEIELVICLTPPKVHAEIMLDALAAGKNAYTEKPFGINQQQGQAILAAAKAKALLCGGAPDTFMGSGIQTCRKLIDDGWIGQPVAATAFFTCRGHERWHPDPEFYYQRGGGPMLDMGPYYLTALVNLIGPVKRVCGSTRMTFPERTITSQPKLGKKITVEVPTHVAGTIDFASGAVGTIVTSFDVWNANLPRIEVHGTEGSLSVPDPNGFGGEVKVCRAWAKDFAPVPHTHSTEVGRGIGLADMAYAIVHGRGHRVSGALAYHVLDVMCAFDESSKAGRHVEITTQCDRPRALPTGLMVGTLDD